MIKKSIFLFFTLCINSIILYASPVILNLEKKPQNFVYLKDIDPTIIQEMRYAGYHNFVGHPLPGYEKATCILTREAAEQLKAIQQQLKPLGYSLKVYDCYRPQKTVDFFIVWSQDIKQQSMKAEFYPNVNKKDVFKLNYVAAQSSHSRGSTIDLTIVKLPAKIQPVYRPNQPLVSCYAPYQQRYRDNSINMGTGYDCFDKLAHPDNTNISSQEYLNRMFLNYWMTKYGFVGVETEWWHFTLKNEPYPGTYFNFVIK